MALPGDVLAKLSSLSGYDQMLEMDAVSRNFGISLGDIESQIRSSIVEWEKNGFSRCCKNEKTTSDTT